MQSLPPALHDGEWLPTQNPKTFEVYRRADIALAKGDKIRITKNGYDRNDRLLNNGEILNVTSIGRDGRINLQHVQSKCRYVIGKDFAHISHAHCITSHGSQGKTVEDVFIAVPAESFGAVDSKQLYVSVSRSKERCFIYTDDKEGLEHRIQDTRERQSAIEMIQEKHLSDHLAAISDKKRDRNPELPRQVEKDRERNLTRIADKQDYEPGL